MPGPVYAPELFDKIVDLIDEIEQSNDSTQKENND